MVPVERCRLVRYDEYTETLDQSFDDNKVCLLSLPSSMLSHTPIYVCTVRMSVCLLGCSILGFFDVW